MPRATGGFANRPTAGLTRACLARPRLAAALLALATLALAAGAPRVEDAFGYRVLVGDEHPVIRGLDQLIGDFGGGQPLGVGWRCGEGAPCDSVFDAASLRMADAVVQALLPCDGVVDVLGVSNMPVLVADDSGFAVRRLVEHGEVAPDVQALAARALDDPQWRNRIVSSDARFAAIFVQAADTAIPTSESIVDALDEVLARHRAQGFEYALVGDAHNAVIMGRRLAASTAELVPILVAAIALVLFALLRCWRATVAALFTMGVAVVWTVGLCGWLGFPKDGILEVLTPLVLVVGVCDAVHFLWAHARGLAADEHPGGDSLARRRRAALGAAREVGWPCLLTSATTGLALLSFVPSGLDTFERFGLLAGFGVFACLVLSFSSLPLLVTALPNLRRAEEHEGDRWRKPIRWLAERCWAHPQRVLIAAAFLLVVCAHGIQSRLVFAQDWSEAYGADTDVTRWEREFQRRLEPYESIEVRLALPDGLEVQEPEALQAIAAFAERLGAIEGAGAGHSIVDWIERMNRLLNGDRSEFERIGASAQANAELVELLTFADAQLVGRWLSLDRRALRVSASFEGWDSAKLERAAPAIDAALAGLPTGWDALVSGSAVAAIGWERDVRGTQLRSFPAALLLVLLVCRVAMRSWREALLAVVPTLASVVVILGALAWAGLALDIVRSMIAAVVLGIGVDDAVHLLRARQLAVMRGLDARAALFEALDRCAPAIVSTSLALAAGFAVFRFSAWNAVASFGSFVSLGVMAALLATLCVLPALVSLGARHGIVAREHGDQCVGTRSATSSLSA